MVDDGVDDAPILVLRDPTTAVDAVTEARMAEGIRRYRGRPGRLTVVMTTSPPLLASCDRVVFLGPAAASSPRTRASSPTPPTPSWCSMSRRILPTATARRSAAVLWNAIAARRALLALTVVLNVAASTAAWPPLLLGRVVDAVTAGGPGARARCSG